MPIKIHTIGAITVVKLEGTRCIFPFPASSTPSFVYSLFTLPKKSEGVLSTVSSPVPNGYNTNKCSHYIYCSLLSIKTNKNDSQQ